MNRKKFLLGTISLFLLFSILPLFFRNSEARGIIPALLLNGNIPLIIIGLWVASLWFLGIQWLGSKQKTQGILLVILTSLVIIFGNFFWILMLRVANMSCIDKVIYSSEQEFIILQSYATGISSGNTKYRFIQVRHGDLDKNVREYKELNQDGIGLEIATDYPECIDFPTTLHYNMSIYNLVECRY